MALERRRLLLLSCARHGEDKSQDEEFGVTYMAAIIDGRVLCRHIKRKEGEW